MAFDFHRSETASLNLKVAQVQQHKDFLILKWFRSTVGECKDKNYPKF